MTGGLDLGGLEVLILRLAEWMREREHHTEVVSLAAADALVPEFVRRAIPVTRLRPARLVSWVYPRALARHIALARADVVHAHTGVWFKAALAARYVQVPVVYTQHGLEPTWAAKSRYVMQLAAPLTRFAVGVTPEIVAHLVTEIGVRPDRARYISNGVPDALLGMAASVEWNGAPITGASRVVVMVGRLQTPKDPMTLVKAAGRLAARVPGVQVVFVGTGPDEANVRSAIHAQGAEPYVHLLGRRDDVGAILRRADVFVLSSRSEGESLAVLEAMSAACPIVATAVGGTPRLLAQGDVGLLVPDGDAVRMADAIAELLEQPALARRLGERARARYLQAYSLDCVAERYLDLYREAAMLP